MRISFWIYFSFNNFLTYFTVDEGEAYEDKKLPDMKKMKLKVDVETNQKFVISAKKDT